MATATPHDASSTRWCRADVRLWIVNHYALPPGATGGPTRHLGLSRALRDRGHEVTILASVFDHYARRHHRQLDGDSWRVEEIDGVRYVWIATPPYGSTVRRVVNMTAFAARAPRVARQLPGPPPDVVIGSSPHLLAPLAAKRIARSHRAGFVLEVRDLWPQSLVDLGELSARHPAVLALERLEGHLYRTADELVTVLPAADGHFLERGASSDHLHVIPNGVELTDRPTPTAHRSGRFTAVYAGTMGLANGLGLVIDAADVLRMRGRDDIDIRLVGSGPEQAGLRARAAALAHVSVEDAIPAEEVPQLLASADAGLLVLRDSPVFRRGISPTKLFDYLGAGLPVITSVRSPSDVAADAGAGLRAEPGNAESLADALETLAGMSRAERERMGARGRAHAESHHSFAALAEQYEMVAKRAAGSDRERVR